MTNQAPLAGWARLSASITYDPKFLGLGAAGRLVFLVGIAAAKLPGADGDVSLRAMIGMQYGALEPSEVIDAARELVDAGLWVEVSDGLYRAANWDRWQVAEKTAKANRTAGAHKTNHSLGRHSSPVDGCPTCHLEKESQKSSEEIGHPQAVEIGSTDGDHLDERSGVSPGGNGQDGYRVGDRVDDRVAQPTRLASLDVDVDVDVENPPAPQPVDNSEVDGIGDDGVETEAEAVELADRLIIDGLGMFTATATAAEVRTVKQALALGHAPEALYDLAAESLTKSNPRAYLLGCLRRRAENGPDGRGQARGPLDAEWDTITALVARHGAGWLTPARGELPDEAWSAANAVRQQIRYSSTAEAKRAYIKARNARPATPADHG